MKRFYFFCFIIILNTNFAISQNDKLIYYNIFKEENSKYRWFNCSNLIYKYISYNKWSADKVKDLIDILSSDEDKINATIGEYWRNHWIQKSNEIKENAQKEFDRNNTQRGNQLILDAKFAEKISTSINDIYITNYTIHYILNKKIKPQGNSLNLPKEQNLQNFRKYYAVNYDEIYEDLWKPKDESAPSDYKPAPYIYHSYSLLGPIPEMIHTYVERTYSKFYSSLNYVPFSFILHGEEKDLYNYSFGLEFKSKFNFSVINPLYEKEHLLLSHNSFKDILDNKEKYDIEGVFYKSKFFWSIISKISYINYNGKFLNDNFYNIYFSFGSGINYLFNKDWLLSLNLYYLGFDYQIKAKSLSLSDGIWYYAITPEIETQINLFNLLEINPYVQFNYHFKGLQRLSTLNIGIGLSLFLGENTNISF